MKRRKAKTHERTTPCQCCGYPISQRHHLLEFAEFGETKYTRQFCANCHELFHIIDRAITDNTNDRAMTLLDAVGNAFGVEDPRIIYLVNLARLVHQARKEMRSQRIASAVFVAFIGGE